MADEPITQQSTSDDQELAKVLAGVSENTAEPEMPNANGTILPAGIPTITPPSEETEDEAPTAVLPEEKVAAPVLPDPIVSIPVPDPTPEPVSTPVTAPAVASVGGDGNLDSIKQEALGELRPLVDKLDVNPEEKFDTYLLLLRSTDDKNLIAPAHDAAKSIPDEARRAQALLDIIKEIDFLSQNQ